MINKKHLIALVIITIVVILNPIGLIAGKKALDRSYPIADEYMVTDNLRLISRPTELFKGMTDFYKKTGIVPHLYMSDNLNKIYYKPTPSEINQFAAKTYNSMFYDDIHFLVVMWRGEDGDYIIGSSIGEEAAKIVSDKDIKNLVSIINKNWTSEISKEEVFSKAFKSIGSKTMSAKSNARILTIVCFITIIVIIKFKKKERKEL